MTGSSTAADSDLLPKSVEPAAGSSSSHVHVAPDRRSAATTWIAAFDARVQKSKVGRLFELKARKTSASQELCAAITVFLTVAQIIAVNPAILSATGGPCTLADCQGRFKGTPRCLNPEVDPGYAACVAKTAQSLVATTCLSAAIGCFLMALLANMPLILIPGMGVNAYVLGMVGQYGSGSLTYSQAMAVVLVTSVLVLLASVGGLRGRLMTLFPTHLVMAMVVGLGFFLALTGLRMHTGIGLVVSHPNALLAAGGCPAHERVHALLLPPGPRTDAEVLQTVDAISTSDLQLTGVYGCRTGVLSSAETWLGIAATLLIVLLMASNVSAAVAWGVVFATVIAWIPGHGASYFTGSPAAAARWQDFRKVVSLPNPSFTSLRIDFSGYRKADAWSATFGLFYLVFLDSTGTAFALASAIDQQLPGFVTQPGFCFPRRMAALLSDALACIPGALMGTSPLIVAAESSVAVEQGGRTGLTTLLTGCFFLGACFFAPLFSNIPAYATGPALIVVGCLMASTARFINWEDITEAFPAFATICIMPFTNSISNGLLAGLTATFALWVLDIGTSLARALLRHRCCGSSSNSDADAGADKGPTARQVLHDKFGKWREAFGDITWSGYKGEVRETFQRATTLRRGGLSFRDVPRSISRLFVRSDTTSSSRFAAEAGGGQLAAGRGASASGASASGRSGQQLAARPSTIVEQDSVQGSSDRSGGGGPAPVGSHPILNGSDAAV